MYYLLQNVEMTNELSHDTPISVFFHTTPPLILKTHVCILFITSLLFLFATAGVGGFPHPSLYKCAPPHHTHTLSAELNQSSVNFPLLGGWSQRKTSGGETPHQWRHVSSWRSGTHDSVWGQRADTCSFPLRRELWRKHRQTERSSPAAPPCKTVTMTLNSFHTSPITLDCNQSNECLQWR